LFGFELAKFTLSCWVCLPEESGDKESEEEEEERDPMPEVTEVRFIPDDANCCESIHKTCRWLLFLNILCLAVKDQKWNYTALLMSDVIAVVIE